MSALMLHSSPGASGPSAQLPKPESAVPDSSKMLASTRTGFAPTLRIAQPASVWSGPAKIAGLAMVPPARTVEATSSSTSPTVLGRMIIVASYLLQIEGVDGVQWRADDAADFQRSSQVLRAAGERRRGAPGE